MGTKYTSERRANRAKMLHRVSMPIDQITGYPIMIDTFHHKIHEGKAWYVMQSVANLGALASPDDALTFTFKTPNTDDLLHFIVSGFGTAGGIVKLVEAATATWAPDASVAILNKHRTIATASGVYDVAATPVVNKVSPGSALATGGTEIWAEYIGGAGGPHASGGAAGGRDEIVLKKNTVYQASLYGNNADPATLIIAWYID